MHCDWVKCIVPLTHKKHIHEGVRARFQDSVDYKLDYKVLEAMHLEGSGSSAVSIRTVDAWEFFQPREDESINDSLMRHCSFLPQDFVVSMISGGGIPEKYKGTYFFVQIEGNLTKFFQGQSIFGSLNAFGLIVDFMYFVCRKFNITPSPHDLNMWRCGFFYPQRIDICDNYYIGNYKDVDSFIHGFVKSGSLNGRGFRFDHNEKEEGFTAVHSTSGRLCRLSIYNKFCDLRDNKYGKPKFEDDELNKRLVDYADGIVRFEAKYKSAWFRRNNIDSMFELRKRYKCLSTLLYDKIEGITFGGANMNDTKLEELKAKLPTHILPVYLFWLDGKTVKQIKELLGGGKRTESADKRYYRASKYLKEEHSINVKVRLTNADVEGKTVPNVIPMIRVIEAKPLEIPDWFYEKGLIYEPSKHGLYAVK